MRAVIFGGSGQIGRSIKAALEKDRWDVTVPTRSVHINGAPNPAAQQIPFSIDEADLEKCLTQVDMVINCIGILAPSGKDTFEYIHCTVPERIARIAHKKGVALFIHISALGADANSASAYARSKAAGEVAVMAAFPGAIIYRPSIVFGPHDSFFNRFAAMARFSPFLPLIGGGHSRFQPVYVEDIALAVLRVVGMKAQSGTIYSLGGPDIFTFKELMQFILRTTGMTRLLIPLPWMVAGMQAWVFEKLPGKILTRDQLKLLRTDNVVPHGQQGFDQMGITPRRVADIVPSYLCAR